MDHAWEHLLLPGHRARKLRVPVEGALVADDAIFAALHHEERKREARHVALEVLKGVHQIDQALHVDYGEGLALLKRLSDVVHVTADSVNHDRALHREKFQSRRHRSCHNFAIPGHANVLRKLKERRAEDETLQLQTWVVQEKSCNDQAAHRVAVKESWETLLELPYQRSQVMVEFFNVRSLASDS